jgi:hypothetical protein
MIIIIIIVATEIWHLEHRYDTWAPITISSQAFEAEQMREKKNGRVAIHTTFNVAHKFKFKFAATKVPRQCPLVLLVNICLVWIRCLEMKKVRWRVEHAEKLSCVLLYTILNFVISFRRAALGEILMLIWFAKGGILMLTLGGPHKRHAVQRGIWVPNQHLLYLKPVRIIFKNSVRTARKT